MSTIANRLIFALILASGGASAASIRVTMAGTINSSNMTAFQVGQGVSVSFTYETSGSPQFIQNQQAFYVDQLSALSITSGSYSTSYSGAFGQIDKYNNLGIFNQDGISFQAAANQATYQFTSPRPQAVTLASVFSNSITQTFDNMFVQLASNNNQLWSDYSMPTSLSLSDFDGNHSMGFGFSGGSFGVTLGSISTVDATATPEPGSGGLVVAGFGCLAGFWLASRRVRSREI